MPARSFKFWCAGIGVGVSEENMEVMRQDNEAFNLRAAGWADIWIEALNAAGLEG
jgi:hypothetical protein